MKHLQLATAVSNQSYANVLLSAFALPRNAKYLEDLAQTFEDADDTRWAVYVVELRTEPNPNITIPVAVMMGEFRDVLRAAICLEPVALAYYNAKRLRRSLEDCMNIIRVPTSFDFMEIKHKDDGKFMSFVEFSNSRRPLPENELNSDYTGSDIDNEDHIKGFVYGEENFNVLITECDHTDMCSVVCDDFSFAEEDQDEAEAVAYRCYLNSKGYYADATLAEHFNRPLGKRRTSITY